MTRARLDVQRLHHKGLWRNAESISRVLVLVTKIKNMTYNPIAVTFLINSDLSKSRSWLTS